MFFIINYKPKMTSIISDEIINLGNIQNGRVKWFNNKAGFGFITFLNNEKEVDVFVHHSSIKVEKEQYKYLVQGEYVEFKLVSVEDNKHQFQAAKVGGINSGKLMCETRREFRISRSNYKNTDDIPKENHPIESLLKDTLEKNTSLNEKVKIPKQTRPSRVRGDGPRDAQKSDWTEITKVRKTPVKTNKKKVFDEK